MTPEEIRIRSAYLFLVCTQAVEQFKNRLTSTLAPPSSPPVLDKLLRRELGLLFRYWTTRKIWAQLEANEADAKALNLALLRLFIEGFKLPKDGSGLRYAELSTPAEELHELSHRLVNALGVEPPALLRELGDGLAGYRDRVLEETTNALTLPLATLTERITQRSGRSSDPS